MGDDCRLTGGVLGKANCRLEGVISNNTVTNDVADGTVSTRYLFLRNCFSELSSIRTHVRITETNIV